MFSALSKTDSAISVIFNMLYVNAYNLDKAKIFLFGRVKPLPNGYILSKSKLKAFADNKKMWLKI